MNPRLLWVAFLAAWPTVAAAAPVPFVGCPSDGQQGPLAAPLSGTVPRAIPAAAAARLAYYSMGEAGVLAPRGWHCIGLIGSNGSIVIVVPGRLDYHRLPPRGPALRGPAVIASFIFGGTSGRFEVVELISRYFLRYRSFVGEVRNMGFELDPLPSGPYPNDRVRRRTRTEVQLTTPALRGGFGTRFWLAPAHEPVEALILLHPQHEMDAVTLLVRLPRPEAALGRSILAQARRPG